MNILIISGSPWFQYRGNHSATYNTLKGVLNQGNKITLLYPAADYLLEMDNARDMMEISPTDLKVLPVNINKKNVNDLYGKTVDYILGTMGRKKIKSLLKQFSMYQNYKVNLNTNFISTVRSVLEKEKYDIIQIDYPQALKVIENLDRYRVPKVFVNHETQMVKALRAFDVEQKEYSEIIKRIGNVESYFMKKYDAVIVLTGVDSEWLKQFYSISAYVSPHAVDTHLFKRRRAMPEQIPLIFVGGESHYPNRDAIEWFCMDIMPILNKKSKNCKLYITGKWSDKTIKMFASDDVIFLGYVADVRAHLSGSISVAPIRIGSGMRVKIVEAMAMECGIVSTTIGCEGLGVKDGKHLLIADNKEEFANAIIELSKDIDLCNTIGAAARNYVVENFSIEVVGKRRAEVYKHIISRYNRK